MRPAIDAEDHKKNFLVPNLSHGFGVAPGQVLVGRHHQGPFPCEGVQVSGQGRRQRLAFARRHFGQTAVVEHHASNQLHVVVAELEHAP